MNARVQLFFGLLLVGVLAVSLAPAGAADAVLRQVQYVPGVCPPPDAVVVGKPATALPSRPVSLSSQSVVHTGSTTGTRAATPAPYAAASCAQAAAVCAAAVYAPAACSGAAVAAYGYMAADDEDSDTDADDDVDD